MSEFEQPCKYCDEPKPMVRLTKDSGGKWDVSEMKEGKRVPHEHNNKKKGGSGFGSGSKKPPITVNINITVADSDTLKTVLGLIKEVQG